MKKTKQAFSIIEVVVASIILSISVFWVFKLISENQKIINNSNNHNTANSLFISFQECLKNINPVITEKYYLNLLACSSGSTQTWISLNNIDYILLYSWTINNTFDLLIKNDSLKIKQEFIIK